MKTIDDELREEGFFAGLNGEELRLIAACGKHRSFKAGTSLAREGGEAKEFFLLRRGHVALQLHTGPADSLILQTLGPGQMVGWSWLFKPYRWTMEVNAVEDTHTVCFDGQCLRGKCAENPKLGYELGKRFSQIMAYRLEAARLQLLNLYDGSAPS